MIKNAKFTPNISSTLRAKDVLKRVFGSLHRPRILFSAICNGDRTKLMHTTDIVAISYPLEMLCLFSFSSKIMSSISTASKRSIAIWTDNLATSSLFPLDLNESLPEFTNNSSMISPVISRLWLVVWQIGFSTVTSPSPTPLSFFSGSGSATVGRNHSSGEDVMSGRRKLPLTLLIFMFPFGASLSLVLPLCRVQLLPSLLHVSLWWLA